MWKKVDLKGGNKLGGWWNCWKSLDLYWPISLGNYLLCKRFTVQILLWWEECDRSSSPEVFLGKGENDFNNVANLQDLVWSLIKFEHGKILF